MIDKNGKLFGKINLIDLIIILILAALVIFAVFKFAVPSEDDSMDTQVKITLFCEETPSYVVDYLKKGAPVLDPKEDITIGTVESFEIGEPIGFATGENGLMYEVTRSNYNSVTIEVEAKGAIGENGVTVDDVLYGVGHTMTVYAGQAKLYLRISSIEAA
ncbi:MAG: DUF4330 family protein [Clostridiales bacterium]|nr:DUF4330 family protein [Clostridiales bacterium]